VVLAGLVLGYFVFERSTGVQKMRSLGMAPGSQAARLNRIKSSRIKSTALGSTALLLVIAASSAAQAQCVVNDPSSLFLTSSSGTRGVSQAGLLAGGASAITSLISATNTINTAFLTQTSAFIGTPANANPVQTFGGVWERGIAGQATTTQNSSSSGNLTFLPSPAAPVTHNLGTAIGNCTTKVQVDYAGYQAGLDLGRLKLGSDGQTNVYFGATVGYVGARARDVSQPGTLSLGLPAPVILAMPADFSAQYQVPFVGAYAALTHGGFFVDGQVLASFYQSELSSTSIGLFAQRLNAEGISVNANIGYHHETGWNNWFVEPSAGVNWSRTRVDPLNAAGTFLTAGTVPANNPVTPTSTLQVNDIDSVLGRIGVRVGTTIQAGQLILQPFGSASLWHEFAGNVSATARGLTNGLVDGTTGGSGLAQPLLSTGSISVDRIGTYAQLGAGLAGQLIGTGFLGYARVDVRTGDRIEAVGFNAGLRYQFDPDPTAPVGIFKAKAPPMAVIEPVNWTGFYFGGFAGTGWGQTDWTFVGPSTGTSPRMAGFLGGGEAGWNYQTGAFVFGVEADLALGGLFGGTSCPNVGAQTFNVAAPVPLATAGVGTNSFTCNETLRYMGTATARIGYAWDRVLVFVKGGGAWIKDDYSAKCNFDSRAFELATSRDCIAPVIAASDKRFGWTVGGGFEYALNKWWSAKAEYDYADFGTKRLVFTDGETADIKKTVNLVKIGVNYRFAWEPVAPIVTKY
jgi:outer membrane autotransporter protein